MADEPKSTRAWPTDVSLVRQTLMRELETINAYEEFATQATSDDVRVFLRHLADDEKEHVAEATALLRALDAVQNTMFEEDVSVAHMRGEPGHEGAHGHKAPAPPTASPLTSRPMALPNGFTVGSLKARKD